MLTVKNFGYDFPYVWKTEVENINDMFSDVFFNSKSFNLDKIFDKELNKDKTSGVLKEFDDFYRFELPVPGLVKENIKVELENKNLIVSYEIKQGEYSDKTLFVSNSFYKKMLLPKSDSENINAKLENGVLIVTVKKVAEPKQVNKVIEIK